MEINSQTHRPLFSHRGFKLLLRRLAVSSLIDILTSIARRAGAIAPLRSALFAYRLRGQCPRPL